MADSSDDSKEEQDANTSAAVEEAVMIDKSSVNCKEHDICKPVDNICYEKLQSKSYPLHQEPMFVIGVPLTK